MMPFNLDHMTAAAEIRLAEFIDGMVHDAKIQMSKRTGPLVIDFGFNPPVMNLKIAPLGINLWVGNLTFTEMRIQSRELTFNLPLGQYEIEVRIPFFKWKKIVVDTRATGHVRMNLVSHYSEMGGVQS